MQGKGFESGSRLRARYYVGDDGSQQFFGWRDTTLNVNCFALTATDGAQRCIPEVVGGISVVYFGDAACTMPIATAPFAACGPPSKYAYAYTAAGCGIQYSVYELGPKMQPAPATIYVKDPTTSACVGNGNSTFDAYPAMLQPPTTFVLMTEMVE